MTQTGTWNAIRNVKNWRYKQYFWWFKLIKCESKTPKDTLWHLYIWSVSTRNRIILSVCFSFSTLRFPSFFPFFTVAIAPGAGGYQVSDAWQRANLVREPDASETVWMGYCDLRFCGCNAKIGSEVLSWLLVRRVMRGFCSEGIATI